MNGNGYEKSNFLVRSFSLPVLAFLNALPANISNAIFLAGSGETGDTRVVFENVGKFKALETMYTYRQRRAEKRLNLSSLFWENFLSNARSIRNRLFLVEEKIKEIICSFQKGEVHLLSIGSGSARPILEACAALDGGAPAKILLVDSDRDAIRYSQTIAQELGVNHIEWIRGNFFRIEKYCTNFRPNVIEMVGLLDYLSDKQALSLLKKIFRILVPDGYLIMGNIAPNPEAPFVTKAINWPMVYRGSEELTRLLEEAGFELVETVQEPLGVHTVAIGRKR